MIWLHGIQIQTKTYFCRTFKKCKKYHAIFSVLVASEIRHVISYEKHIAESYTTEYSNKKHTYAALECIFSF